MAKSNLNVMVYDPYNEEDDFWDALEEDPMDGEDEEAYTTTTATQEDINER